MSRRATVIPETVAYALEAFSLGELQAGVKFTYPERREVPVSPANPRGYIIEPSEHRMKGTRIPASTLHKFATGQWKPGPRSIAKLLNFVKNYKYNALRAVGVSREEASRVSRWKFERWLSHYEFYRLTLAKMAKAKGADPLYMAWGMAHSSTWIIPEDWIKYASDRPELFDDEDIAEMEALLYGEDNE